MYKLCLIDFDGTLCATHDAIVHCMFKTFDHYDHPRPDVARVHAAIKGGVGIAQTFASLHETGLSVPQSEEWRQIYRDIYNSGDGQARSTLFEGAEGLLRTLKENDIPAVVVSNKGEQAVLNAIAHFNLGGYFHMVIAERDGLVLKPDPSSWHELIAPAYPHIAASDVLMIGDTPSDLGYARNIGAKSCWARYGYGDPDLCMAQAPDHIIDALADLNKILF